MFINLQTVYVSAYDICINLSEQKDTMSDKSGSVWHLHDVDVTGLFCQRGDQELSTLSSSKKYKKGDVIYLPADASDRIFYISEGKVKISRFSAEGKELILLILGPGQVFGEMSIVSGTNREELAEALADCEICSLSKVDFKQVLEANTKVSLSVTKLIGLRLKRLQGRLESLCFKNAEDRVKLFIKELVDEHGRVLANGEEVEVKLRLTHEDIGKLTATSRQSVTTILRALEKEEIILYDRRRILVKQYDKL